MQREQRKAYREAGRNKAPVATRPSRGAATRRRRSGGPQAFFIDFIGIISLGMIFITILRALGMQNQFLMVLVALIVAKLIVSFVRYRFF